MKFARVRLKDMFHKDREGNLYLNRPETLGWNRVRFMNPLECDHTETMCNECIDSWRCDYDVRL